MNNDQKDQKDQKEQLSNDQPLSTGRIRPPTTSSLDAPCSMLYLGDEFQAFLSYDSIRRISRLGIERSSYSEDRKPQYKVVVKYVVPSGHESTVESVSLDKLEVAASTLNQLHALLRAAGRIC
jgi:hypothetical protein